MIGCYVEGDEPVPGYRLGGILGWGQFGQVWKAEGPGGTEVALKVVNLRETDTLKEFRNIRRVRQIRHPNLVPIAAFWLKDRQGNLIDEEVLTDAVQAQAHAVELIIAMGLGEMTLAERLLECQALDLRGIPSPELLSYVRDVARALDYLNRPIHDLGEGPVALQHCDVKPQNILLVGGAVQVCDLGIIRIVGDARRTTSMGTAAYIAPEILKDGQPSSATDQYSLAVSYTELRTGQLPINGNSTARALLAHLNGRLDLSRLPEAERHVITKATHLDPEKRFPNCSTMFEALAQAGERATVRVDPEFILDLPEDTPPSGAEMAPLVKRPPTQIDRPTERVPRMDPGSRKSRVPLSEEDFPVPALPPSEPAALQPPAAVTALPAAPDPAEVPANAGRAPKPHGQHTFSRPWSVTMPPAICAGIMFGCLMALVARKSSPPAAYAEADHVAAPEEQVGLPHPVVPPTRLKPVAVQVGEAAAPFEVGEGKLPHSSLSEAIAAARDGDRIRIRSHATFALAPLEIRGKVLTLQAAPGFRPVLVRSATALRVPWQALLASDRALTLEGIELRDDYAGTASEPTYLLFSEGAPLTLTDCRLLAPRGTAAVVARNPGHVRLTKCWIVVHQFALCLETSDTPACQLTLTDNSICTEAPAGAAISTMSSACSVGSVTKYHGLSPGHTQRSAVNSNSIAADPTE